MADMMLPWPRRRPEPGTTPAESADISRSPEEPASPPHYEIQRVDEDGSRGPAELLPITRPPWDAQMGRRGFFGVGIASSAAAAILGLTACDKTGSSSPSSPSYTYPSYPSYSPPSYSYPSSPTYSPPTTTDDPGDGNGYGGTYCSCNKVCTCIPICQAHRLLDPDPVVRRMAETAVTAMGLGQRRYLAWAADNASPALAARIDALVADLRHGRTLDPSELFEPDAEDYLDAPDPVTAIMAAQLLTLRAATLGVRVPQDRAAQVASALDAGRRLHRRRAPLWAGHATARPVSGCASLR